MALPAPSPRSTALVTGASSGIGVAIARDLASRGHGVTLVARRRERLQELAQELEKLGVRAEAIEADLTDPEARDRMAETIEELGLTVEILVNNAGFGGGGKFATAEREHLIQMTRLNIEAVVDLLGRYLPPMIERGRGGVINVASTAAFQPLPGSSTYAATKAFVLSLGDALHAETGGTGVTVTTLCPGPVKTEFAEVAGYGDVDKRYPDAVWMDVDQVAADGVAGLENGKRVVVPGALNRVGAVAGHHAPRFLSLPLAARVMRRTRD